MMISSNAVSILLFIIITINNALDTRIKYPIDIMVILYFIIYKTRFYSNFKRILVMVEDGRSLLFFRYSFGFLMMVYCANKITDDPIMIKNNQFILGYSYRIPISIDDLMNTFPWFTKNSLYWKIHPSFLLLSATGIAYGSGFISTLSCFIFSFLKMVLTLQDQSHYNNHEYLYSLLALAFGLVDCHQNLSSSLYGLSVSTFGVSYLMIHNSLYGIAGNIAIIGCIVMWIGIILHIYNSKSDHDDNNIHKVKSWNIYMIRMIIISIYTYAGIAKTDIDWYSGMTLRSLLNERSNWIGPTAPFFINLFNFKYHKYYDHIIMVMAYGGMLLDLLSSFGFLTSKSFFKYPYLLSVFAFHLTNHYLFIIETFPWVMLSSCAIFYNPIWLDYIGSILELIIKIVIKPLFFSLSYLWKFLRYMIIMSIVIIVVVIPFPCAWNSILANGDLQWGSQCQFFNWRMMTRSVKVVSFYLRIHHPITGHIDVKSIHEMGYNPNQDNGMECIAIYEDRLYDWVKGIKVPTESQKYISPDIYADIFLEVNGPPIQRYIDPNVNLSKQHIPKFSFPCKSILDCVNWLFKKPNALAPWVVPRISKYRTLQWMNDYVNLEKTEVSRISASNPDSRPDVIFIADHAESGTFSMVLEEFTFLQLLDGSVEVMHFGRLNTGTCMFARGVLSLKTIADNTDNTSLWMVSVLNGKNNKFGIVSYKEALEKPVFMDSPILRGRNCTIFKSDIDQKKEKRRKTNEIENSKKLKNLKIN